MKPLAKLTNTEKAKLLHELFPNEIPALLKYIQGVCETTKEKKQSLRTTWDDGLMDFDYWMELLNEVETKIHKYGDKFNHRAGLFADQLFGGMLALFTNHCLRLYTTVRVHPDLKFTMAVDLLFNA